MVFRHKANFLSYTSQQTPEGAVYKTYVEVLSNVDCDLQMDDGYTYIEGYGAARKDNTYLLFLPRSYYSSIEGGFKVYVVDFDLTFLIEKKIPYVTHLEVLLKEAVEDDG